MGVNLEPGKVIAGRFVLERLLGQGGMGQVWSAVHEVTRRRVALKFVRAEYLTDKHKRRFVREARAASLVEHENVITIHDVFELDDGTPLMVMDLLEGETLGARLERDETIELDELASLMLPVISAVGTGHARGIIHRDLKPENIFLAEERVVVLDFGIAKLVDTPSGKSATTAEGQVVGTPSYMAPEQCLADSALDHRVDIWALGAVLYEALSGGRPVDGSNYAQVVRSLLRSAIPPLSSCAPDTPDDVNDLVMGMLAKDPDHRPTLRHAMTTLANYSAIEVPAFDESTQAAVDVEEDSPTITSARGLVTEEPSTAPTRRSVSSSVGWVIAGLAAAALVFVWQSSSNTPTPSPAASDGTRFVPLPSPSPASAAPSAVPIASAPPSASPPSTTVSTPTSGPPRPAAVRRVTVPETKRSSAATTAPSRSSLIEQSPY